MIMQAAPMFKLKKEAKQVKNNDMDSIICLISEVITEYIKEDKNSKDDSNEKSL
jgi:hypothetical protein